MRSKLYINDVNNNERDIITSKTAAAEHRFDNISTETPAAPPGISSSTNSNIPSRNSKSLPSIVPPRRRRPRVKLKSSNNNENLQQASSELSKATASSSLSLSLEDPSMLLPTMSMPADASNTSNNYEIMTAKKKDSTKMTVTLSDCLACSGCITSSESVLVTDTHSITSLKRLIADSGITSAAPITSAILPVLSENDQSTVDTATTANAMNTTIISTDSSATTTNINGSGGDNFFGSGGIAYTLSSVIVADLSRILNTPYDWTMRALTCFLHQNACANVVVDGNVTQELALVECGKEFVQRYSSSSSNNSNFSSATAVMNDEWKLPLELKTTSDTIIPSVALNSTMDRMIPKDGSNMEPYTLKHHITGGGAVARTSEATLPVISSSCPGFICYVEKTCHEALPYLSTVKSPMMLSGSLLKQHHQKRKETSVQKHVAIMPCHDKKLEGSRLDFVRNNMDEFGNIDESKKDDVDKDVDMVLTAAELWEWILELATQAAATVPEYDIDVTKYQSAIGINSGGSSSIHEQNNANEEKMDIERTDATMSLYENSITPKKTASITVTPTVLTYLRQCLHQQEQQQNKNKAINVLSLRNYYETTDNLFPTTVLRPHAKYSLQDGNISRTFNIPPPPLLLTNQPCNQDTDTSAKTAIKSPNIVKATTTNGSGGYADFIFRYAAKTLFYYDIPDDVELPWKNVVFSGGGTSGAVASKGASRVIKRRRRTGTSGNGKELISDFREVALYRLLDGKYTTDPNGNKTADGSSLPLQCVLKFATAYGFKNVQTIIQNKLIKRQISEYHYVEIMACPNSGCVNGNGLVSSIQLVKKDNGDSNDVAMSTILARKRETPKDIRERVILTKQVLASVAPSNNDNSINSDNISDVGVGIDATRPDKQEPITQVHTRFHAVPKLQLNQGAVDGVALEDTKW